MEILLNIGLVIAGLALLCFGGNWLVSGGESIAKKLRMSPMIIGMTIVAYGTSTPELASSFAAIHHPDIILGNIVGSNISNIGMVIGISAIILALTVNKKSVQKIIPIMIGVSLLLVILSIDGSITWHDGILLLGILIIFTLYIYKNSVKNREKYDKSIKVNIPKTILLIGLGITSLYGGGVLAIDNAVVVAETFGVSERVIGLTVIAIGTSLPELITSAIAIRRGKLDIGIGNILGSNIYNILMIIGVVSLITTIPVSAQIHVDYTIMIIFSLALILLLRTGKISRKFGVVLASGYVAYIIMTLII